jgi:hypothetical protein
VDEAGVVADAQVLTRGADRQVVVPVAVEIADCEGPSEPVASLPGVVRDLALSDVEGTRAELPHDHHVAVGRADG